MTTLRSRKATDRDERRARAWSKAAEVIRRFGLTEPAHLDIERIACALDAEVEDAELVSAVGQMIVNHATAGAARRPVDRGAWIRVSRDIRSRARRAFTIAHELGHFLLHHVPVSAGEVCTSREIDGQSRRPEEEEANAFASALVLPEAMIARWAYAPHANLDAVREIASTFTVAIKTAAIRLVELTPHPWAVVICKDGKVSSVSRSRTFRGYVIDRWIPGHQSGVVECVAWRDAPRAEREVPASTWCRDASATDAPLIEDCMILPGGSDVLAILRNAVS